ncbi:hypothetical protein B0H16DRAFT_1720731 [Mycena metata]|uniref:Uncharacterized protein n=1 Tax=Mycena metata TaxID=1033252 RepID=A0AAD7J7U6_9AGAR|nr:hypothetical protein B0H16DRAFT_1720731 [Mycena metata]
MLSTRFIALVVASIAAMAIATPDTDGGIIKACQGPNWTGQCDTVGFTADVCFRLPDRQVNNLDSVEIPGGWICTFYRQVPGGFDCDDGQPQSATILAPGSSNLYLQRFNDAAKSFKCFRRCW